MTSHIDPGVAVGLAAIALLFMYAFWRWLKRLGDCGNHHFEEYDLPSLTSRRGEYRFRYMKGSNGSRFIEVKKQATCAHEGCEATDEEWFRVRQTGNYGRNLPDFITDP